MASEKVTHILKSRGAPFSDDEIRDMRDVEGWAWIYANEPAKKRMPKSNAAQICFTGFGPTDKEILTEAATAAGLVVRRGVTKALTHLCTGPDPGPVRLQKAQEQGIQIIDIDGFLALLGQVETP